MRVVANVAHGLLAAEEGAVGKAIPDLGEQPAERIRVLLESAQQTHAVAETRRVPELETIAPRRLEERVAFGLQGDVREVADLAHVAAQERPGQRGLADVRMRDQAQRDVRHAGVWVRPACTPPRSTNHASSP